MMCKMVIWLEENYVAEDDDIPLRAILALVEKLYEENVPWNEYQWRLCVSYRKSNQVT